MVIAIKYLEKKELVDKIIQGLVCLKKELTELRLIGDDEDKKRHLTYILDKETKSIEIETSTILSKDMVLARNQQPIGKDAEDKLVYNEWLIPVEKVKENYGLDVYNRLTRQFVGYPKRTTLRVIEITSEIFAFFKTCNAVDEEERIHLSVPWGNGEMLARKGDFLTDSGYSIAASNMEAYEIIQQRIKEMYSQTMENHFFKILNPLVESTTLTPPITNVDVKDNLNESPIKEQIAAIKEETADSIGFNLTKT